VFRQLEQNVPAFRREIRNTARRVFGNTSLKNQQWVAARMMGRKPNGDPLIPQSTHSPKRSNRLAAWVAARLIAHVQNSDPEKKKKYSRAWVDTLLNKLVALPTGRKLDSSQKKPNDFLYYFEDRFGLRCPIGAHIRRANPRDSLGPDPDTALRLSKMHRIIRRGRPYGKQLPKGPKRKNAQGQDEQRGMLFICLNADIAGQFELIQHSWINNGRFGGLYGETDPIMNYPGEDRLLTIQRRPTSEDVDRTKRRPTGRRVGQTKRADSLEQFVTVRGGAYLFLPGIRALRFLAG
jgi:deferrochelatase/peroxidase EfeB